MIIVIFVLGIRAGAIDWWAVSVSTAFMIFLLIVGVKLISRQRRPGAKTKKH